jgi:hypothetical protein
LYSLHRALHPPPKASVSSSFLTGLLCLR